VPEPAESVTWTDPDDPARRRFRKIELDTPFESVLRWGGGLAVLSAVLVVWADVRSGSRSLSLHAPDRWVVLVASLALSLAVAFFGLLLLTDNFYLIDPDRRRVLSHIRFGPFRRVAPVTGDHDILVVTTDSRFGWYGYGRWWSRPSSFDKSPASQDQRVVLVTKQGRVVGMSNWRRDGLWTSNNEARDLAAELGCTYHEAPEQFRLSVTRAAGVATADFVPLTTWDQYTRSGWYLVFLAGLGIASYVAYVLSGK
jgi:hypothetical protein